MTWTLKYGRCHWLQVLGLDRHYTRAEIVASVRGNSLENPRSRRRIEC